VAADSDHLHHQRHHCGELDLLWHRNLVYSPPVEWAWRLHYLAWVVLARVVDEHKFSGNELLHQETTEPFVLLAPPRNQSFHRTRMNLIVH